MESKDKVSKEVPDAYKGSEWRMNSDANLKLRTEVRCALLTRQDECRSPVPTADKNAQNSCSVYICTSIVMKRIASINWTITLLVRATQGWQESCLLPVREDRGSSNTDELMRILNKVLFHDLLGSGHHEWGSIFIDWFLTFTVSKCFFEFSGTDITGIYICVPAFPYMLPCDPGAQVGNLPRARMKHSIKAKLCRSSPWVINRWHFWQV